MKVNFVRGTTVDRDFVHWRMAAFYNDLAVAHDGDPVRWAGFSLDQFMAISWRVKNWFLSGSFSMTFHFTASNGITPLTAIFTETLTNAPVAYQKIAGIVQASSGENPLLTPYLLGTPAANEGEIMDFANPKFREWRLDTTYQEVIPSVLNLGADPFHLLTPIGGVEGLGKPGSNNRLDLQVGTPAYDSANSWSTKTPADLPLISRSVAGDATLYDGPENPPWTAISFRALHLQPPLLVSGVTPQERIFFDAVTKKFYAPFQLSRGNQTILIIPVVPPSGTGFFIHNAKFGLAPGSPMTGWTNTIAGNLNILGLSGDPIEIPIYVFMPSTNTSGTISDPVANFTLTPNELWPYS